MSTDLAKLYGGPLAEFIAVRKALAKAARGNEAERIKRLPKPTVVPWTINQVYWHDRAAYDRLLERGKQLREAQLAAIGGRATDLRVATDAHRAALAAVMKSANRFGEQARSHPDPDQLMRTLEALSLAPAPPEPHGQLTRVLRPAGFEALAGITPKARPIGAITPEPRAQPRAAPALTPGSSRKQSKSDERRARAAARLAERKARERQRAESTARAVLERARANEVRARAAWERAKQDVDAAERRLSMVNANVKG